MQKLVECCLIVTTFLRCVPANAQDSLLHQFVNAQTPQEAGALSERIFQDVDSEFLDPLHLVSSRNHSIALQCEWRLHHRLLPPKQANFGITPEVSHLPDIQRFVGFLEGRLRVQAPIWWEEMMHSPDKLHPARTGATTNKWATFSVDPHDVDTATTDLIVGAELRPAPIKTLQWLAREGVPSQYTAVLADGELVVVSKPQTGSKARIACVATGRHAEKWRNDVWGTDQFTEVSSGPPVIPVEVITLVVSPEDITVFGATSLQVKHTRGHDFIRSAFYVEQFARKDGRCHARFATNNWGVAADTKLDARLD